MNDLAYGEYKLLDGDREDAWRKATIYESPLIRFQKYNQIFPQKFLGISKKVLDFETREDDVWIASQLKSGSTWMGELTWCLMNDLDFDRAKKENLDTRMTYLEINSMCLDCQESLVPQNVIEIATQNKSPRLIKTHLSFEMLPKQVLQNKNKIIYMIRNPRDVCISVYNHFRIFNNYKATLEEHVDHFLSGNCGYYSPHEENIRGFLQHRDLPHILFLTYEEMKQDLSLVIDKVGDFIGLPRLEKEAKSRLMEHLNFSNMKKNPAVNREAASKVYYNDGCFINKGIVGNWKTTFTPEIIKRFEEWEKEKFKDVDFKFTYEV